MTLFVHVLGSNHISISMGEIRDILEQLKLKGSKSGQFNPSAFEGSPSGIQYSNGAWYMSLEI